MDFMKTPCTRTCRYAVAFRRCRPPAAVLRGCLFAGAILFAAMLVCPAVRADSAEKVVRLFRIGTGGSTGVYYPVGRLIATGLTGAEASTGDPADGEHGIPGFIGVAQNSAGSVENTRAVTRGEIEAGLVQADVAAQAHGGEKVFSGDAAGRSIRALASLYPEKLQIVTRFDAGIRSVTDFKGKRISIDEIGSGTLAVMQAVLTAYGLTEADFSPVYLKPAFTRDKMIRGEVLGFAMMAGVPMDAVTQLSDIKISLVPIAPDVAARIQRQIPYLVPGIIPRGVYPGIDETPTIEVYALLVVDDSMDEQLAYRATASLWSQRTRRLLREGHRQGGAIALETALKGVPIPLHKGAQRYYREKGLLP